MRFIQRLSFLPVFIIFMTSLYAQDVHYNYDHSANFGAYKTYQWVDLPGPGGAVPDQLIDQSIKRAVDEQLAQKGLTRVDKWRGSPRRLSRHCQRGKRHQLVGIW